MSLLSLSKRKIHNLVADKKFSEILTGAAWALGARGIVTALGMVISIIIARCYGVKVPGILAMLNSFLILATILTVVGTKSSILPMLKVWEK